MKTKEYQAYVVKTADKRLARLDANISRVFNGLLEQKGWNRQRLSQKSGIPHSTLSLVMGGSEKQRSWNMRLLLRLAVVFGVKLSDIILAAETREESAVVLLHAAEGTEPGSRERLDRIVKAVAPAGTSQELAESFYSVDMLALAAPLFVEKYTKGAISDKDAYEQLAEIQGNLEPGENLWSKVSSIVTDGNLSGD